MAKMAKIVRIKQEKPYVKPTLTIYGTVRDLTKTTAPHGQLDGGSGNRTTSL
jgi:hypothetical protein